jgi:asparagine synthetase B (glutamine-hydrolysing)
MSGWLIVRTEQGVALDQAAWSRALEAASGQALEKWSTPDGRTMAAAWRRDSGEYRESGRLHRKTGSPRCVAWVGACFEDSGETTTSTIEHLREGEVFAARAASVNGAFAAAVIEGDTGALQLWTDRHRQYLVHLARGEGWVAASTEMGAVLPFLARPRLNLPAIDLFLRVGEFIEGQTPVAQVEVLPSATGLRVAPGVPESARRYWKLEHRADAGISFDAAASEIGARLSASVRRVEAAYPRLITPLSGGLDSRVILGLCRVPERVPSVTWGVPGCRDRDYAERFAARVKSPHESFSFDPAAYVPAWPVGAAATGGCFPVRDMFVLPFVPGLSQKADVALNGLAGDAFLGGNFFKTSWNEERSVDALAEASWRWRVPDEEEEWTAALLKGAVDPGQARQAWIRSIAGWGSARPIEVLNDWLLENRVFRFTNCGTQLLRLGLESYSPFFDRDLVEYLRRVPLEYRARHRLYIRMLQVACPAAAEIPWQRTAIPPGWGATAALASLAAHRVLRAVGKRVGVDPFPRQRVASPADWLRGPWAEPARAVLFGERSRDRKIVAPDALVRLWDAHQAGRDLSRCLGAALALELFCVKFLDRLPALARAQPVEGRTP